MKKSHPLPAGDLGAFLRHAALNKEEAEESVACAGTALEASSFKVSGKAFLFVGQKDARLKLQGSLVQAGEMAQLHPGCVKVGAHGWITITFGSPANLAIPMLEAWVEESYRVMKGKKDRSSP